MPEAAKVQSWLSCDENAGESVGDEGGAVAGGVHECVYGVKPYDADEMRLTYSDLSRSGNRALMVVVEDGGTGDVRVSFAVAAAVVAAAVVAAVVYGVHWCFHLHLQFSQ